MKKLWIFFVLFPIIAGCSSQYKKIPDDTPTPTESICRNLKNDLTFNRTSSFNVNSVSPTQEAEMIHLYKKTYDCSRFEEE